MNNKILIFALIALVLISAGGFYFGKVLQTKKEIALEIQLPSATPTPVEMNSWKDQSEFEFKYPKNLSLNSHPEDNENYAHLELTQSSVPGSVMLWAKDTKFTTIDDYIKGNKITNSIQSTLGGLPAVKLIDPTDNNKFSLITIRNGYLYQIDINSAGIKSWNEAFNLIADSYQFTKDTNPAPQNTVSDDTSTEEETIE